MTTKTLLFMVASCLLLTGCERYTFKVNDHPINNPPELYSGYAIADPALASCVGEAIKDQGVSHAGQLTRLNCSYAGINRLDGITEFTGLKFLDLSGNAVVNIKPLLYLPSLEIVNLENNPGLNCDGIELLSKQVSQGLSVPKQCN